MSTTTTERKQKKKVVFTTFDQTDYEVCRDLKETYGVAIDTAQTIRTLMDNDQWDDNLLPRLKKAELVDDFNWTVSDCYELEQELRKHTL